MRVRTADYGFCGMMDWRCHKHLYIRYLEYFIVLARSKSFTNAAEELYITQPMLTKVIKQLEKDLNAKLIERTTKSFRLTDVGEAFLAQAEYILERSNDMHRIVSDIKSALIGKVYLCLPGIFLDLYFAPLLIEFRKKYPGIDIHIIEAGSKVVVQSVLSGDADLGVVMLPVASASQFEMQTLLRDTCQLMVNKSHPFAQRDCVHIAELKTERMIAFSETASMHDSFISLCEEHGFVPHIAYKTLVPNFTVNILTHSPCVAVLPRPEIIRYMTDDLTAVRLIPELECNLSIIYKKERYQSFAALKLHRTVCDYFSGLASADPH